MVYLSGAGLPRLSWKKGCSPRILNDSFLHVHYDTFGAAIAEQAYFVNDCYPVQTVEIVS